MIDRNDQGKIDIPFLGSKMIIEYMKIVMTHKKLKLKIT